MTRARSSSQHHVTTEQILHHQGSHAALITRRVVRPPLIAGVRVAGVPTHAARNSVRTFSTVSISRV